MPPSNKIWTINDVGSIGSGRNDGGGRASSNDYPNGVDAASLPSSAAVDHAPSSLKCCHIPKLPNAQQAKTLLARVVSEFEPIIKQRGYNVLSVSELCCCNDGLDFEPTANGHKRRKKGKMSNNVWGYNQTTQSGYPKSHTIHLRMRHPIGHETRFLPYEDVAGTMAHELAHCEHGPHNDKFYKLMDEILDQHAGLMASNLSYNGAFIPSFTGTGQTLGGGNQGMAAARKQQQQQARPGYKLGGDNQFTQWMTPAEAAVAAAEARRRQQQLRLRGDHCCRPCTITIDDDSEEEAADRGDSDESKPKAGAIRLGKSFISIPGIQDTKKRGSEFAAAEAIDVENLQQQLQKELPPKSNGKVSNVASLPASHGCIDLTVDSSDEETTAVRPKKKKVTALVLAATSLAEWACSKCTYHNLPPALACSICHSERNLKAR